MRDTRHIDTLKNWEQNPRSISPENFDRLKKQIQKLGQYKPLLITEDGTVLGGNMRLKAYKELGIDNIWVSVVDAPTDEKKIEYALSDNDRVGQYDSDMMANLIGNFPEVEWGDYAVDLKAPTLVTDLIEKFTEVEEDEPPAVVEGEPESKLGEVYQLGRHRLMCGDATKIEDVEKLMNGQKADMVLTDPPYNVAEDSDNYAASASKAHDKLQGSAWDYNFEPSAVMDSIALNIAKDCYIYMFTSHRLFGEIVDLFEQRFGNSSFIVWCKPNPMPSLAKTTWTFATELAVTSRVGRPVFNYPSGEHCLNWLDIAKNSDGTHPTQKPLDLCAKIIKLSSAPDSSVLDLFGGSGSTLIACEQTNRTCYMMELDPKYCDVIRKRYQNYIENNKKQ